MRVSGRRTTAAFPMRYRLCPRLLLRTCAPAARDQFQFGISREQGWQSMRQDAGDCPGRSADGRLLILRSPIDARNARLRMSGRIIGRSMRRGAMKVAILEQPRRFAVADRPVPGAEASEVVVRIAATAVCHTDLDMYLGHHPGVRYPVVLGHEATGTIATVGADVRGLQPGQNVIINPVISCGRCDCCRRGDEHLCRNAGIIGREFEGSLSQYIRLRALRFIFFGPCGFFGTECFRAVFQGNQHHWGARPDARRYGALNRTGRVRQDRRVEFHYLSVPA